MIGIVSCVSLSKEICSILEVAVITGEIIFDQSHSLAFELEMMGIFVVLGFFTIEPMDNMKPYH